MRTLLEQAGPLDGIYVCNHGAMTATHDPDPDGALYALARDMLGPDKPVIATVDLHANISERMVHSANAIVSYRTNPHVDQRERAAEAAYILRRLLAGERFEKTFIRLPIAAPTVTLLTVQGAYADMIAAGQRYLGPDVPLVSVVAGFVFSNGPKTGLSVLTYETGGARRNWRYNWRTWPGRIGSAFASDSPAWRKPYGGRAKSVIQQVDQRYTWPMWPIIQAVVDVATPRTFWQGSWPPTCSAPYWAILSTRTWRRAVMPRESALELQVVFNATNANAHARAIPAEIEMLGHCPMAISLDAVASIKDALRNWGRQRRFVRVDSPWLYFSAESEFADPAFSRAFSPQYPCLSFSDGEVAWPFPSRV